MEEQTSSILTSFLTTPVRRLRSRSDRRHQEPICPQSLHDPHRPTGCNRRRVSHLFLLPLLQVVDSKPHFARLGLPTRRNGLLAPDLLEAPLLPDQSPLPLWIHPPRSLLHQRDRLPL